MALFVTKFGGSSVASVEKMRNVCAKIVEMKDQGNDVVVVVSAMGDTTDDLLKLAGSVGENLKYRELDMLLSTGEQQSAALMAVSLIAMGCPAISLTGWQAGIKTDGQHSKAR
ncbi:MAG: aspartate kinase, partial [Syntrophomonas sp.]|nr:aspartate kinase [Syntrophomonas sp.]